MARDEKIIAVIPARLNSKRLSNKLLLKIENITILEHVIIRLILSDSFSKIIVASPNNKIKNGSAPPPRLDRNSVGTRTG